MSIIGRAVLVVVAILVAAAPGSAFAAVLTCNPSLNQPQRPFKIYGDAYYVGTRGVSSILIASDKGLVLIDGDLEASAPQIAGNIRALGFHLRDVKLILNSHVHCDHAGGIAQLQRMSGAAVKASPASAAVLRAGGVGKSDPQLGISAPIQPVANVSTIADGQTLNVGPIAVTAHFTPGHTPGGTSWTWNACEGRRCLHMVYADSLSAMSAPGFSFTRSTAYPNAIADFEKSFRVLERAPCDILITVHPELNDLWSRLDRRSAGNPDALIDPAACRRYAAWGRAGLAKRVASEKAR